MLPEPAILLRYRLAGTPAPEELPVLAEAEELIA
jgi:hypothetical protein